MGIEKCEKNMKFQGNIFWKELKHQEVGGVTNAVAKVGTYFQTEFLLLPNQERVTRKLGHILKPDLFHRTSRKRKMGEEEDLRDDSLVTRGVHLMHQNVVVRCVAQKDREIRRKLSHEELCGIYDIPLSCRDSFKNAVTLPFLTELPLKILTCVLGVSLI